MAGIERALITSVEVAELFPAPGVATVTFEVLPDSIIDKINDMRQALRQSYNIPHGRPVYITSDIHSDLEKLMFLFYNAGLIDRYYTTNPYDVALPHYKTYAANLPEIIDTITNFRVRPTPFICILVGDIVDGQRINGSVNDPIGNLEILLHVFLFNFRIKARILGSELRFTIGNHDWHTVVANYIDVEMYLMYVENNAKTFFNVNYNLTYDQIEISWINRRNTLLPFYDVCPYLVVSIDTEVICVHGGLFRDGNPFHGEPATVNMTNHLILIQQKIDQANSLSAFSVAEVAFLANDPPSPLWTRYYANKTRMDACIRTPFKMTVVGHCPTADRYPGYIHELKDELRYDGCERGGCVLVGCERGDNGPELAFVDIGMSRAFRPGNPNDAHRRGDLLYLSHDDAGPDTRFYNNVSRINATVYPAVLIQIYPPSPESPVPALPALPAGPDPPALPAAPAANINIAGGRRGHKRTYRKRTASKRILRKRKMSKKNRR